jgi:hypothetical protein
LRKYSRLPSAVKQGQLRAYPKANPRAYATSTAALSKSLPHLSPPPSHNCHAAFTRSFDTGAVEDNRNQGGSSVETISSTYESKQRTTESESLSAPACCPNIGRNHLTWQVLPEFRKLAINPGDQLPRDGFSDIVSVGVLCVMQIAFWCRVLFVPIPFRRPGAILNHVFLFLGKLSFIRIDYAGVFGIGTRLQASQG